jgi:hypothetical protein
MPRYFFHLIDSTDELLDPDGLLMDADAVPSAAMEQARDCIAGDVINGRLDLHYRIDVQTGAGEIVHSLRFEDALEVVALT